MKSAFKHCQKYYGMKYRKDPAYQMQDCIDNCGRGYSTQAQIKVLWGHLDELPLNVTSSARCILS